MTSHQDQTQPGDGAAVSEPGVTSGRLRGRRRWNRWRQHGCGEKDPLVLGLVAKPAPARQVFGGPPAG